MIAYLGQQQQQNNQTKRSLKKQVNLEGNDHCWRRKPLKGFTDIHEKRETKRLTFCTDTENEIPNGTTPAGSKTTFLSRAVGGLELER